MKKENNSIPENFINGSLKKRRQAFLDDTVNHFSKNNRAIGGQGECFYSQKVKGGCAIGRFLPTEVGDFLDKKTKGKISSVLASHSELIPNWLKDLGTDFLEAVQDLHDDNSYWNDKGKVGLCSLGLKCVKSIEEEFINE